MILVCTGVVSPKAVAQDSPLPSGLSSLFGLDSRPARLLEIEKIARDAERSGEWRQGMTDLAAVARTAKEAGDRTAWVEAELAWVRLAAKDGEESDLDDALEDLVSRARDWGLSRQEADVYSFWAERLEDEGQWLMALRALDGAVQASLGDGLVNRAMKALLKMSRLCRDNAHPWRLQQVWVRIAQVERELGGSIDESVLGLTEEERALSMPLFAGLPPVAPVPAEVDIQPSRAAVRVSAPHGEVGRARFFLTNETVRTVHGTLKVAPGTGALKKWESGNSGHWLTLGAAPAAKSVEAGPSTSRDLSLRPGERVSVYVEREQPATRDTVSLTWSAPGGEALATGDFAFAASEPPTSVTNAGSVTVRPGWSVPFYHEFNYRGTKPKIEDFQFLSNLPCRLEIFDMDGGLHPLVDTGTLLALDADGDGCFISENDRVLSDLNGDGNPDIIIGDRSRSIEVFAWPLVPLSDGQELTVSASLRPGSEQGAWRKVAEDILRASIPE